MSNFDQGPTKDLFKVLTEKRNIKLKFSIWLFNMTDNILSTLKSLLKMLLIILSTFYQSDLISFNATVCLTSQLRCMRSKHFLQSRAKPLACSSIPLKWISCSLIITCRLYICCSTLIFSFVLPSKELVLSWIVTSSFKDSLYNWFRLIPKK